MTQIHGEGDLDDGLTLNVRYDTSVWVSLDDSPDAEGRVVDIARERLVAAGRVADADSVTRLSTALWAVTRSIFAQYRDDYGLDPFVFVHCPLDRPPLPLGPVLVVAELGEELADDEQTLWLAGADDADAIEPPAVSWVDTPLGRAARCKRFLRHAAEPGEQAPASVFLALTYVWNLPELETSVRLVCADDDVGQVATALDEIDELARGIVCAAGGHLLSM